MGMKLAKRNTFLINPEGKIAKEWIGVDPSHHSQEVLTAIQDLQKSNPAHAELRDDIRP
jgi:peroxiredoxin Q/BCP